MKKIQDKTFLLTDLCMWEQNKQNGTKCPHAIVVVDEKTGQTYNILSGSRIKFVDGNITEPLSQDGYNELTNQS